MRIWYVTPLSNKRPVKINFKIEHDSDMDSDIDIELICVCHIDLKSRFTFLKETKFLYI